MADRAPGFKPRPRHLLILVVLGLAIYTVVPRIGDFRSSRHLLEHLDYGWAVAAVVFTALTYLAGAATYSLLAFKRLRYWRTVIVQLAAMFVNRLLPGGVGALGANYLYLRRQKHSGLQAASIVTLNNLLGVVGHNLLLVGFFVVSGHLPPAPGHSSQSLTMLITWLVVGLAALAIILIVVGRKRLRHLVASLRTQLAYYKRRPGRLVAALVSSAALTMANVLCLACCALAVGVHLPIAAAILILTLGVSASTAVPTPGGLGSFEAGLVAGLVAYGVDSGTALAVALLYRLISYWLAVLVGGMAFVFVQRRQWLTV